LQENAFDNDSGTTISTIRVIQATEVPEKVVSKLKVTDPRCQQCNNKTLAHFLSVVAKNHLVKMYFPEEKFA